MPAKLLLAFFRVKIDKVTNLERDMRGESAA